MKILMLAFEVAGIFKTGGLADVVSSLSQGLVMKGHNVEIVMPLHASLKLPSESYLSTTIPFEVDGQMVHVTIWAYEWKPNIRIYFLDNPDFIGKVTKTWEDDSDKYGAFNRAIFEAIKKGIWRPDVIHLHDWHAALIPLLLKQNALYYRTVLTIHNIRYQGVLSTRLMRFMPYVSMSAQLESDLADGNIDLLLQGINSADVITTVSKKYAEEIKTEFYGAGLHLILEGKKIHGILNGLDYSYWNPSKDPFLDSNFSTPEDRSENKRLLCEKFGFDSDTFLMGFIGRLDSGQKGLDLLEGAIRQGIGEFGNIIVLGQGDRQWEQRLQSLAGEYDNVKVVIAYDEALAHRIYASTDVMLVPSLYEPCGLIQMIGMRYGSLPIGHNVGGLSETIDTGVNGWLFDEYTSEAFLAAVYRARALYHENHDIWKKMQVQAMMTEFDWKSSIIAYESIYLQSFAVQNNSAD